MSAEAPDPVAVRMRELVLADFQKPAAPPAYPSKALWAELKRCGSELWLDTGDLDEIASLWCSEFTAVTTNNTLLNREVQRGIYDGLIAKVGRELAGRLPQQELVLEIAFVLNAYHGLRLSRQFGAKVSVELHTDLAYDVERSVRYARRYFEIAPEGFFIKVPFTAAGVIAARRLSEEGVPVNFTLGFSARQNYLITALARPAFVNVFLGRLNSFVADQGLGTGKMVGERATLASQRVVSDLRARLGLETRQIAASMREGAQVASLVGVDVLTMPPKVALEFERLGPVAGAISSRLAELPPVELAPGVDRQALGLDGLWDVCGELEAAARRLAGMDVAGLSPEELCWLLSQMGLGCILPRWSEADIEAVTADGKIPRYDRWKGRLARQEVGLDTLMTFSGLQSFAADQKAMDDRIRSML